MTICMPSTRTARNSGHLLPGVGSDSSPAIGADGTIYVGSDDDHLYAIYPNGTRNGRFPPGMSIPLRRSERMAPSMSGRMTISMPSTRTARKSGLSHRIGSIPPRSSGWMAPSTSAPVMTVSMPSQGSGTPSSAQNGTISPNSAHISRLRRQLHLHHDAKHRLYSEHLVAGWHAGTVRRHNVHADEYHRQPYHRGDLYAVDLHHHRERGHPWRHQPEYRANCHLRQQPDLHRDPASPTIWFISGRWTARWYRPAARCIP